MAKSWSAMGTVNKPVNASKAPKGTVFGAPNKIKTMPKKTQKKMMKQLGRNYS